MAYASTYSTLRTQLGAKLSSTDIHLLIVDAFRYGFANRASNPSEIARLLIDRAFDLDLETRQTIAQEIETELHSGGEFTPQELETWLIVLKKLIGPAL